MANTGNKTLAKNASMLYIRMLVSMAISFYTSRLVLQALGVSDYGIYNLVGGIIVLINSITSALSNATSRYLTYSLGTNDEVFCRRTFSTAFYIHLGISFLFLLVAESLGVWFINTQLSISPDRMVATNWVYQASLLSTFLGITQVPYNATITAHERFDVFAYIDILTSLLKLGITILVLYLTVDHLIAYSVLYVLVSICVMLFYHFYCVAHFTETRIDRFDRNILGEMMTFSLWSFFEGSSLTVSQQGQNILLNRWFGTIINAAVGVSSQLGATIYAFIGNITTAFKPQIIIAYAQGDYKRINELIKLGTQAASIFILLITIPVIINLPYLMHLWLKDVPDGAVEITAIILCVNFFNSFNPMTYTAVAATGKIRNLSIFSGLIYIARLLLVYIVLRITGSYLLVFAFGFFTTASTCILYTYCLKNSVSEFNIRIFYLHTILPLLAIALICGGIVWGVTVLLPDGLLRLLLTTPLAIVSVVLLAYYVVLDESTRKVCISIVKNRILERFSNLLWFNSKLRR